MDREQLPVANLVAAFLGGLAGRRLPPPLAAEFGKENGSGCEEQACHCHCGNLLRLGFWLGAGSVFVLLVLGAWLSGYCRGWCDTRWAATGHGGATVGAATGPGTRVPLLSGVVGESLGSSPSSPSRDASESSVGDELAVWKPRRRSI